MLSAYDSFWLMTIIRGFARKLSSDCRVLFEFTDDSSIGVGGCSRFDRQYDTDLFNQVRRVAVSDDGMVVYQGSGNSNKVQPEYVVRIGVAEIFSENCELDCNTVLATVLSSMMHELRHVEQYEAGRDISKRPDDMRPEVLWSLVATCGNPQIRRDNYHYWPHEVDAERVGVLLTYNKLCGVLGEHNACVAMGKSMQYVTELGISPVSYDGCPVEFDEDWFKQRMNKAMILAKRHKREVMRFVNNGCHDFAAEYLALNDNDRREFESLTSFNPFKVRSEQGCNQDIYLAKINVNFRKIDREFFDRLALSFPMNFPEPSGGVVDRPVVVQSLNHNHTLIDDSDIVCSDEQKNSEDIGLSY